MRTRVLLATLLAGLAACGSTPSGTGEHGFRTLSRGYQTGLRGAQTEVARTASQWATLWNEHARGELSRPNPPSVDFTREMVVCVLLGDRPSSGYGIEVESAEVRAGQLVISARETKPVEGMLVPQIATRPYHMIATPRANGAVRLELR